MNEFFQIVGYNIRPPEWCHHQCSYYLTLHHTTMSAPFYTSERIFSPHPKWKEIDSGKYFFSFMLYSAHSRVI